MNCCWHWDFPHPQSRYATSAGRTGCFSGCELLWRKNVPRTSSGGHSENHHFRCNSSFPAQPRSSPQALPRKKTQQKPATFKTSQRPSHELVIPLPMFLTRGGIASPTGLAFPGFLPQVWNWKWKVKRPYRQSLIWYFFANFHKEKQIVIPHTKFFFNYFTHTHIQKWDP